MKTAARLLLFVLASAAAPPLTAEDTVAPALQITGPIGGAVPAYGPQGGLLSGTVNVTANASDDVGVTRVDFHVDGVLVFTDTASPYAFSWNSAGAPDGFHYVQAMAYDAAGNEAVDIFYADVSNSAPPPAAPGRDVTSLLQNLGNPSLARWPNNNSSEYARNVWDMHLFNGRIYLGHGNSSNAPPATNAGPIPLWYFDPSSGAFATDRIVGANCGTDCIDEEQIDTFRPINGTLYLASHDPKGLGGQFYRIEGAAWRKHANLAEYPDIHNYDIAAHGGRLFVSGGFVAFSDDDGLTWQSEFTCRDETGAAASCFMGRSYRLSTWDGKLYVSAYVPRGVHGPRTNLTVYAGNNVFQFMDGAAAAAMFPPLAADARVQYERRFARETAVGTNLVYIGAQSINDHQWLPVSLMKASSFGNAQRIVLPANPIPRDVLAVGPTLYVLGHTGTNGNFTNFVHASTDLVNWTEVLRFTYPTFARSMEYHNGFFYFGMGTETRPLSTAAGDILRAPDPATEASPLPPAPPRGFRRK